VNIIETDLSDVLIFETPIFQDQRGYFEELYRESQGDALGSVTFVQDNHSRSNKNVLRGLHFQEPHGQGKLVRVLSGALQDVVVDVRRGSPTFGKSISLELKAGDGKSVWIPEGFAHGILALEDNTDLLYKVTSYWSPETERTIRWNDPDLAITWNCASPILNEKDAAAPLLKDLAHLPDYSSDQ